MEQMKKQVYDDMIRTASQMLTSRPNNFETTAEALLELLAKSYNLSKISVFESESSEGDINFSRSLFWSEAKLPIERSSVSRIKWDMIEALEPNIMSKQYLAISDCRHHPINKIIVDYDVMEVRAVLYCLIVQQGKVMGAVAYADCRQTREWSREEIKSLMTISNVLGSNMVQYRYNQKQETEIWQMSNYDRLTGMMSMDQFLEYTKDGSWQNPDRSYMVVCYELRDLRLVNETYGFSAGNQLIQQFAYFLQAYLGETSQIGKASAHTFIEIRECVMDIEEEGKALQSRANLFCQLQERSYGIMDLSVKIGICRLTDTQNGFVRAIEGAGVACNFIVNLHGSNYKIFDEEMEKKNHQEMEIRKKMRSALRNDEFVVYYQPKINLKSGKMVGMEALTRWRKADGSLIPPDTFIPLFEKNGFIELLDEYVLHRVLQDILRWKADGKTLVPVSVNLSGWVLKRDSCIRNRIKLIRESGIDASLIEFELTETVCGESPERTREVLSQLKEEGFRVSLDDFGSGYAVLGMLPQMPVDVIKIDKSLLSPRNDGSRQSVLLDAVVHMLKRLGFTVLCEGIEEKEQLDMLCELGCELGQGYYFSKPVSREVFEKKYMDV